MRITLAVTAGPARGQAFIFDEPDCFLFGRAVDARVSLPDDPFVSRHHFLLEVAPPNCRVTDLDSRNGILVNNVRYGGRKPPGPGVQQAPGRAKQTLLRDGDEIVVGDTRMKVVIELDAMCVGCDKVIPDEQRKELAFAGGTYLCAECRSKQATKAAPTPQEARAVHCTHCKKDVTAEAGTLSRLEGVRYVCKACRADEKAEPQALLDAILGFSTTAPAVAGAPLVHGAPTIRGYHIEKELGRGGMAVLYKATENSTGRTVAIKMVLPAVAVSESAAARFLREAEIRRQLKHPNIVEVIGHGRDNGAFFLVLEFVDGMDLQCLVTSKGGKLDLAEAAPIMLGILDGLAYAHRAKTKIHVAGGALREFAGIVHRDLNPAGIFLARSGGGWTPKISDFTLAKNFESAGLTDITDPGTVCGTPLYWPREQITHYRYLAPPTDVFSIAAVFYEMLAGGYARDGFHQLFVESSRRRRSPSLADFMRVIVENPIAPLRSRNRSVPRSVADVIDRALRETEVTADEKKMRLALAELRYPDAGAFRDALEKALNSVESSSPEETLDEVTQDTAAGAVVEHSDQTLTWEGGSPRATLTHNARAEAADPTDKVNWEIGEVIDGTYEVTAVLGRDGMSVAYRLRHRRWGVDLAIKMPLAHRLADEGSKARFIREANTWVALGLHPNIVRCWYVRVLGGVPCIFTDYMGEGSLKQWIREGRVKPGEWDKILDLMIQACDALAYLHEKGVVHRDVKPANFLMNDDGHLCVADFGIVRIVEGAEVAAEALSGDAQITEETGSMIGTPEYGAPEQWGDAETADARADIYALGVVLFELCCGQRPFDDGSHSDPSHVLMGRHFSMPPPDPREINRNIPAVLSRTILQCLAKKREQRPESATKLRELLAGAYREILGKPYGREVPKPAELQADALNNRAVSLCELGEKEAALAVWAKALKLDGQHPESLYNKGLIEWRQQEATDIQVVEALRAAKRSNKRAGLYLGYFDVERAAADEAVKELTEALGDTELAKDGAAWRALGDAHLALAQDSRTRARIAYEKALELMPGDPLPLQSLALASENTGGRDGRTELSRRLGDLEVGRFRAALQVCRQQGQGDVKASTQKRAAPQTDVIGSVDVESGVVAPSIDGYRIEEELGRGGVTVLYRATQNSTGRRVAIKTTRPWAATIERILRIFLRREAEVMRQLKHPNIVEMIEYGQAKDSPFLVFELVDGMDLGSLVTSKGGKLDLAEAVPLMMGILDGLAHAHRAKIRAARGASMESACIIHRDLKPANIVLARDSGGWTPKIANFGQPGSFESTDALCGEMIVPEEDWGWGSALYWPREYVTHYKYLTPSTDVFSIAAVFYEMLAGAAARDGLGELFTECAGRRCRPSVPDIMSVMMKQPIARLRSRNRDIPQSVADVIDRALHEAEVPADGNMRAALAELRYPDAGFFRDAMGKALKQEGILV